MTFRNPVIPGFRPDPSVCRVGNEYFLVTSSFTYCPGVPIFRSSNLVGWTQIGNVLGRPSQLDLTATRDCHHDRRIWMITTNVGTTGTKSYFVTSEDPAGPWSDPGPVRDGPYDVAVRGDRLVARARVGPLEAVVGQAPRPGGAVHTLARLDGRYLSTEVTGGFLGRMIGIYAVGGEAAFDWFNYEAA